MSVILQRNDTIILYCKGADSVIYDRLGRNQQDLKARTQEHLNVRLLFLAITNRLITLSYFPEIRRRRPADACASRTAAIEGVLRLVAASAKGSCLIARR